MGLILPVIVAVSLAGQGSNAQPLKLKAGDTVSITAASYGGDFSVMNDGAIYGKGFGRVAVAGLSILDSEKAVRTALKRFVKEQLIFVTLKSQRPDFVFLVGQTGGGQGPTPWQPDITLRQVLAQANLSGSLDQMEVSVLRGGRPVYRGTIEETLKPTNTNDPQLSPNDVVSVVPLEQIRVWVSGSVRTPGEVRIRTGSDLSRVLASVGGMNIPGDENLDDVQVLVRRGPTTNQYAARDVSLLKTISIEPGDDISVVLPTSTRITVAGEVTRPGEILLKGDNKLQKALAMAGGPTPKGTLSMVRVVRQGELFTFDATRASETFSLQANDLVVVERNEKSFYVLGEVSNAGRYLMEDNRIYRVTDALSAAGGLGQKGTYRRVYLARAGVDGKTVLKQFNLDEFLKDGKLESNPLIQPGDCLLFGQPNGLSFSAASQVLSSFVLLNTLVGK